MRYFSLITFLSLSCLFLGCINSSEEYSDINFNGSPLAQGEVQIVGASSDLTDTSVCNVLDQVDLLLQSNLGSYFIDEAGHIDATSKLPFIKSINSIDDVVEFVQTYKLNDNIKTELFSIDYNVNVVKMVYIGNRSVYNYKFNISSICNDNSLTLEVISAPAMSELVSFWGVFVKLPAQLKDSNLILMDKEVSVEEYDSYPDIPNM